KSFTEFLGEGVARDRFLATLTEAGPMNFEAPLCPAGGSGVEVHVSASHIRERDGVAGVVWIVRDVSDLNERKRELEVARAELLAKNAELESMRMELEDRNQKLELLTKTDELTGIANARHFRERLRHEVSRGQRYGHPLSLLLIDLDKFKNLNDSQGHQRGDEMLRTVAQLFRREMREADLIARYGGDEFVVLLPDTSLGQAEVVADKLRADLVRVMEQPNFCEVPISISVGVAALGEGGAHDATSLVREADEAMYRAKAEGGNRVVAAARPAAPRDAARVGPAPQGEARPASPPKPQAARPPG
ncbi:MAG: diguanylate cyclase, partial [Myxococcales bacterium]|nr:diguanylate cyclase [Myxococcales bacterium]